MPEELHEHSLFGPHADMFLSREEISEEQRQERRKELLAALGRSDLGTIEVRVAWVLQHYPETRESDTELAIRFWLKFQGLVVAEHTSDGIRILHRLKPQIESITRARRRVQNTLGLFQGSPRTQLARGEIELEFYKYMGEVGSRDPEIRFFLDESGAEPNSPVAAVGGICIINWLQYERFHAALSEWRTKCNKRDSFHFGEMHPTDESLYMSWLGELAKYRGGLLFCGYAIESARLPHLQIRHLFLHLVVDSLHRLREQGCLTEPRRLVIVKEQHQQFDTFELPQLEAELSQRVHGDFPKLVELQSVTKAVKGSDVMLEYADLVAASMVRRMVHESHNHKSRVAEAVMNTTGLNQESEGAVFKLFHTGRSL